MHVNLLQSVSVSSRLLTLKANTKTKLSLVLIPNQDFYVFIRHLSLQQFDSYTQKSEYRMMHYRHDLLSSMRLLRDQR